eukprot:TRINITY_DN891_c0_g1_i1.p1 TRINITY_DN891_c0_g1~~TRINITY_DN891_c0_g1_i1.p1  ORF type:complete len:400 (+),score=46.51 TRINITY_DN891_c0_g1_i1:668-1867(+)
MMNKFENLKSIAQNVTVKTVHLDSGVPFLYEVYPETQSIGNPTSQPDQYYTIIIYVSQQPTSYYKEKTYISYPRIMQVRKETSFSDLHLLIYQKFQPYFEKLFKGKVVYKKDSSLEEIKKEYEKIFPAFRENEHPYQLKQKIRKQQGIIYTTTLDNCVFCSKKNCRCSVPSDSEILETIYKDSPEIFMEASFNNKFAKEQLPDCKCSEYNDPNVTTQNSQSDQILQNTSIYDCLNQFTTPEILEQDNCWYCPQCKKHKQAQKTLQIFKAPPILIVHLKRFKSKVRFSYYETYSKLNQPVYFPEQLDLSKLILSDQQLDKEYQLYAYVNHYGGAGGGHYTACAFNQKVQQWVHFDDSRKSFMNSYDSESTQNAYVLFFKRKNFGDKDLKEIFTKLQKESN